jgi:hypothetical protein
MFHRLRLEIRRLANKSAVLLISTGILASGYKIDINVGVPVWIGALYGAELLKPDELGSPYRNKSLIEAFHLSRRYVW